MQPATKQDLTDLRANINIDMKQHIDDLTLKFFRYTDEKFKAVDERLDYQDQRIDGLYGLVDALAKPTEIYRQEMLARNYQFERMEKWIHQIAQKIGLKLEY